MTAEQKIRKYFDDHFLLQRPYAKKADISEDRFYRILNGKTSITANEFFQLAKALGVKPQELFNYGEEEEA